jgi:hypothetical protein
MYLFPSTCQPPFLPLSLIPVIKGHQSLVRCLSRGRLHDPRQKRWTVIKKGTDSLGNTPLLAFGDAPA